MIQQQHFYIGANNRKSTFDVTLSETEENKPIVFFIHGFKGYKDWGPFNLVAQSFAKEGFIFIKLNLSHNGTTAENLIDFPDLEAFGRNTFSKELYDVQVALDEAKSLEIVKRNWNKQDVYVLGHSRGGGLSFISAAQTQLFSKVATWAAISNVEGRFTPQQIAYWQKEGVIYIPNARTNQQMPLYLDLLEDYKENEEYLAISNNVKRIHELNIAQLIIHGTADETVPLTEAEELANWNPNAELIIYEKANHTFGAAQPWVSETLPPDLNKAVIDSIRFFRS